MVENPDGGKYQPNCLLAHELINKISVVVGHCDLVKDVTDNPAVHTRLQTIRNIATEIAASLTKHQCQIEAAVREKVKRNSALGKRF